ncbi:MAG: inorganic phosphate transporter [Deltaproteobacteria bacterium RIFCSPLOWO2_02_FULL_50_16]|nr:MAG: inorganic phosphate transporter [Deltaproteobacteria bacterium RIFCSPLOWO2_02_FULL_50_16]
MTTTFLFVVFIILIALAFDFINGFHDAANSVATVVSTRVLSPKQAVIWAAFFNFVAVGVFGLHVATTIGKGIIDPSVVDSSVILSALMGAIVWDLLTWWWGLPTSSSHALIGGLVGAAVAKTASFSILVLSGLIKVSVFIFIAPFLGIAFGFIFITVLNIIFARKRPSQVDRHFRRLQLVSAAFYSLGHGGNDAQKTMGIITILLFSNGFLGPVFYVPLWVALICHLAIALGTMAGGWRIIKTMGMKITELKPAGGFCAEAAAAATLFGATALGVPVSTTHTITGGIVGVGVTRGLGSVRWTVATRIVWAWILTIPASAIIAAVSYYLSQIF